MTRMIVQPRRVDGVWTIMQNKIDTLELPLNESRCDARHARTDHVLHIPGTQSGLGRWGVGGVRRGASGRQVDGGPLVPGPWAYAYQLCTTIDNRGGTARESANGREAGTEHTLAHGDVICFDGCTYRVSVDKRGYVDLIPTGAS